MVATSSARPARKAGGASSTGATARRSAATTASARKAVAKKAASKKTTAATINRSNAKNATAQRAPTASGPAGELRDSAAVDAWFRSKNHPQEATMRRLRDVLLAADPRLGECIKWSTPTFTYRGNLASINPQARQFTSLMFHTGAQIPGRHPELSGSGDTARYMRFDDPADVDRKRPALAALVAAWCALKDGA